MGRCAHGRNRRNTRKETSRGTWVITFSDKLSVMGTLLVMLVAVAICAVLERAFISGYVEDKSRSSTDQAVGADGLPARSGRTTPRPTPTTPAEILREQAARQVMAVRGPRVRLAYQIPVLPDPEVRLSRMNAQRTWAFGNAVIPTPETVTALPDSALFLARATGSRWTIELAGTPGFSRLLGQAPASVVPKAERTALGRYGAPPGAGNANGQSTPGAQGASTAGNPQGTPGGAAAARGKAQTSKAATAAGLKAATGAKKTKKPAKAKKQKKASGSKGSKVPKNGENAKGTAAARNTGLMLPWRVGQSWSLEKWVRGDQSLRFHGGDGKVVAAGAGRLYRLCSDDLDHGLIMIVHPDGLATQYYQLSETARLNDGSTVERGEYLGRVSTDRPCGGDPAAQAELRFALRGADSVIPLDGARIGGWTIHTTLADTWADREGVRVDARSPLLNFGPEGGLPALDLLRAATAAAAS